MRIAIDARLVSYTSGGISEYTLGLARALAALESGDEILLLEGRRAKDNPGWPEAAQRVRLLTPPHHRLEQLTLPLELMHLAPDLLHSPDFIPPFRRRCRSVITIHDLAFLRFPGLLTPESARYYGQVRRAVESADRVIAVSEATRRDLLRLLSADPDKITVVHEAADPAFRPLDPPVRELHRTRLGLPARFVLFVGTLEPRKNIPTLLKAFAAVRLRHDVSLVVVGGKGWLYEDVFGTRDSLGLGDAVVFRGRVPPAELLYYYNSASCLALPSLYEGFGLPALEAMACSTPVIVSNVSSLPEITGNAALAVDPHDVEGLAAAIDRLLTDEDLRARLQALGPARAAGFSWEKAARETLAVYHKALG